MRDTSSDFGNHTALLGKRIRMGSQRRPFTEEMGPQLGLEGQEKNQLMRKIRQCTRMERRNAEVKVSKVDLAVVVGGRYSGLSRDSIYVNIEKKCCKSKLEPYWDASNRGWALF